MRNIILQFFSTQGVEMTDKLLSRFAHIQSHIANIDDIDDLLALSEAAAKTFCRCMEQARIKKRGRDGEEEEEEDDDDDDDEVRDKTCTGPIWRKTPPSSEHKRGRKLDPECKNKRKKGGFVPYPQEAASEDTKHWLCKLCLNAYNNDIRAGNYTKQQVYEAIKL